MRIIVTGANGFIGTLLVKYLFSKGINVVSVVHPNYCSNIEIISNYSESVIKCNLLDKKDIELLNKFQINAVIHLAWAGVNGIEKGNENVQKSNIEMALNMGEFCIKKGIKKFIGVGTITEKAYLYSGKSDSPSLLYGKYKNECYLQLARLFKPSNVDFYWLQLSNLYGSTNKTGSIINYEIDCLQKNITPEFGPCDQYYDFLLVDNAIDAIYRFTCTDVKNDTNKFFIGSGRPLILRDYLITVAKSYSKTASILIGVRKPDNMIFEKSFFDISDTVKAIGDDYITGSFETNILGVIEKIKKWKD